MGVILEAYINGMAGERFGVRILEQRSCRRIGDHGCGMTGGTVVVLGKQEEILLLVSGGIAYVF
jgi:glutamate synthase domain-containing protein 3